MCGPPVSGVGRAVRMCGYRVVGRGNERVMSTSTLFGAKGLKAGSCIVVAGAMVARGGISMEENTALPGSRKKVIAERPHQ